ncbi:MAG: sugar transferase, partial [Solirubrobacteraceae bacterium]
MSAGALDPPQMPAPQTAVPHTRPPAAIGRRRWVDAACRALDVVLAAAALIALAPLLLMIAAVVRLESPGSALFRQTRIGRGLRPFTVNKFRTMRAGVETDSHRRFVESLIAGVLPPPVLDGRAGPRFKLAGDERITRVGRLLRRTSFDELPQLWNVLRGEMSLVGPRPPIPYEVERYPEHWFERFEVKPGLTGLWQVSGRCEL